MKSVEFLEGRKALGKGTDVWSKLFQDSKVEEIMLPSTLREISYNIFEDCESLRVVRMAKGCKAKVKKCVGKSVKVLKK